MFARRAILTSTLPILLGVLLLVGCGGDKSTKPGASDYYGDYTLDAVAVDGSSSHSLPAVVYQFEDETVEMTAGSISLGRDHRFVGSLIGRRTITGHTPTMENQLIQGAFAVAGDGSFTFQTDGESVSDAHGDIVPWSRGRTALRLINDDDTQFFFVRT